MTNEEQISKWIKDTKNIMSQLKYDKYKKEGFEGDINSPSFLFYLKLLEIIEEFKQNVPLKWKRWNYIKIKQKIFLILKD